MGWFGLRSDAMVRWLIGCSSVRNSTGLVGWRGLRVRVGAGTGVGCELDTRGQPTAPATTRTFYLGRCCYFGFWQAEEVPPSYIYTGLETIQEATVFHSQVIERLFSLSYYLHACP